MHANSLCLVIFYVLLLWTEGARANTSNLSSNLHPIYGEYSGVALIDLLSDIEKRYNIHFYYNSDWFQSDTVNLLFSGISQEMFLKEVFGSGLYSWIVLQDNHIVLLPTQDVAERLGKFENLPKHGDDYDEDDAYHNIGDPKNAGKYSSVNLSGTVSDGNSGEPIIGSTLRFENTGKGTVTNIQGYYQLHLSPGTYNITVSSIGFEQARYRIKIFNDGMLNIPLYEKSVKLDEVSVYARRANENVARNQMSVVEMDAKTIKQLPNISGDKDLIKGFVLMPGVKSVGEFGSGINVRGGGEDQNLYLIDDAPIFGTSHVFGLISVVNPDAVTNVTLYKGHIPGQYGERVSSVMDIRTKDNTITKWQTKGGIGIYNSRLMVSGPVIKDRVFVKLGGRTSYSDFLLSKIQDYNLQNSSASFHDLNGLISVNLKKNLFSLSAYTSYDDFTYAGNQTYRYGNRLGSAEWMHLFKSNAILRLIFSQSNYQTQREDRADEFYEKSISSGIKYNSLRSEFSFMPLKNHNSSLGFQIIRYLTSPGIRKPESENSLIEALQLPREKALEGAFYINDSWDISSRVSLTTGLRLSFYSYLGPGEIRIYEKNKPLGYNTLIDVRSFADRKSLTNQHGIEPRISAKYLLQNDKSVKLSFNRSFQYLYQISYSAISAPDDIWKLSDPYLNPMISNQIALGYYQNLKNNAVEFSMEIYYKNLENIPEYKDNASLEMNPTIETELLQAKGRNYGVEILVKKNTGLITGWITYTYSRSLRRTTGIFQSESINDNRWFPSSYDKPHDFNIVGNYHVNRRMRFSGNFTIATGRPVTLPEYEYWAGNEKIIYFSDRNKYRLPHYHRLDVSFSVDESLKKAKFWKGSWTFSILNIYGRRNAYSVFYKKETPEYANQYKTYSLYKLYILGNPIPTLTYNFIF